MTLLQTEATCRWVAATRHVPFWTESFAMEVRRYLDNWRTLKGL